MSTAPESPDHDPSATPAPSEIEAHVDPVISEVVHDVSNRFGAQGLADLIALARDELARAEAALKELESLGD